MFHRCATERSTNMHLSRSCMAMLLSLVFLTGLAGCGQASSDKTSNLGAGAGAGEQPIPRQGLSPRTDRVASATPAASSLSLTLGYGPAAASGKGIIPGVEGPAGAPVQPTKPTDELDPLVVPAWITKDLDSPDVGTRLRALETWAQSAPPGAVDPLILALDNTDERVRTRAMELIEQDWARTADSEQ